MVEQRGGNNLVTKDGKIDSGTKNSNAGERSVVTEHGFGSIVSLLELLSSFF